MPRTGHRLVNGAIDEAVVFSRALTRERNKRGDDRWVIGIAVVFLPILTPHNNNNQ